MYDEQLFKNHCLLENMDEFMDKILKIKERINPDTIEQIENMHVKIRTK